MIRKILVLSLTLLSVLSAVAAAGAEPEGPSIVLPQSRIEFAPVAEGVEVVQEFEVRNQGSAPLLIEKVRTG